MINYYEQQGKLHLWQLIAYLIFSYALVISVLGFIQRKEIKDFQNQTIACRNDNTQIKNNVEKLVKSLTGEKPDVEIMLIPTELKTN